ncbi:MAG: glycosyltransferase family 9 protein [Terriglobia bacterium]
MTAVPQKFLVIRLSSLGDVVNALPAVAALGQAHRHAEITWAIEPKYASLLTGNPFVSRVIEIDTLGWRGRLAAPATWREIAQSVRALRAGVFDAVVDFQGLVKTGVAAWLCRSPRRIGFAKYRHREAGAGLFYTERVAPPTGHVIEEYLALVRRLGAETHGPWQFPLPCSSRSQQEVEAALAEVGVRDYLLVSPGGGWIRKRWSPVQYAELAARLEGVIPWSIVFTGSRAEEGMILEIIRHSGASRARYVPTSLLQFIALARSAKLFIGGDTGPLHVAAALKVPIVAIYGPTDPARNGPFSPADIALSNRAPVNHTRRGARQTFLEGISVENVLAAVQSRLARADAN